ncbi:MAG: CBU_0592 family membrane protein [Cognaticolwellia sp.]
MTMILVGWLGTILYLVNHGYISLIAKWRKNIYYAGNAIAAICLVISSTVSHSWQAVVINSFWTIISISLLFGFDLTNVKFNKHIFRVIVAAMLIVFCGQYLLEQTFNLTLLGWISAFVFSACYLLFSADKMLPRYYLLWNAFAAVTLLPQLWLDQNWPVFALEIAWAIISIYGAIRRFEQVHLVQ